MEAAINSAIIQTPADPSDVPGNCSSGNCTFPIYQTMGVCSTLDDITPTIVRNCHHENTGASTRCFYSVKDLQTHPPWREDNFTAEGIEMTLWVGASFIRIDENNYPDPNSLGEFYTIYLPNTTAYDSEANFTKALVALKGSLNLCVISYQTNVTNGITKTVETSRATDLIWRPLQKTTNNTNTSVIWTTSGGKEYWISQDSGYAFKNYLSLDVFYGHSQTGIGGDRGSTDAAVTLAGLLVNQKNGQNALSKMLDNLATSMTNA